MAPNSESHQDFVCDYRPNRWLILFLTALATIGNVIVAYLAVTHRGPLDTVRLQLTEFQARLLFTITALGMPFGIFCLAGMAWIAWRQDRRVVLTSTSLIVPRPSRLGFSNDELRLPLDGISRVYETDFIGSTKLIRIEYGSDVLHIPSNMLANRQVFGELLNRLTAACQQGAGHAATNPRSQSVNP